MSTPVISNHLFFLFLAGSAADILYSVDKALDMSLSLESCAEFMMCVDQAGLS